MNNKLIVSNCPNFYKVNEFEFYEDDFITATIIDTYKEYIFSINDIEKIKKIDYILGKYIDDYLFRKEIRRNIDGNDIVKSMFNVCENYEFGYTRNIYFARWI